MMNIFKAVWSRKQINLHRDVMPIMVKKENKMDEWNECVILPLPVFEQIL